jgi:4-hydroxy-4-methyl-2-oxoglutarate aldolase
MTAVAHGILNLSHPACAPRPHVSLGLGVCLEIGVRSLEDSMTVPATTLPTAAIADASVRLGIAVRAAPASLRPLTAATPSMGTFQGPARPVTHLGSVDVLLETIDDAPAGSVLVVDNAGREDEACLGDLIVLEASLAGFAGIVVWGRHRDSAQLVEIGLPLHSLGAYPFGPRRVPPPGRAMRSAYLDGVPVTEHDYVVADDDGVLFVSADHRRDVFSLAEEIQRTEAAQARRMAGGDSLRAQLDFAGYRARQAGDPTLTLRQHLLERGNSIEV